METGGLPPRKEHRWTRRIAIRATPNDPLTAAEPATIFRHHASATHATAPTQSRPLPAAPDPAATDLAWLTVAEAAALLAARRLSPVELTAAVLAQIERLNPRIQAYAVVTGDAAMAAAKAAEREIVAGDRRGPLHGIPLALKDLVETAGIPTTASSQVLADYIPQRQAAVAERLAAAGTILLGKSYTHEFAYGMITPSTRNPHNLDHIPGGSSGGSAAAIASGMATLAIGTDTGGSIRIPASFCGTVGLKPTYGRVSRRGVVSLSWSMDHVGPITRSVEDAALMLQAIAGHDPRDGASAPVPVPDYTATLRDGVRDLKIGVCRGAYFENVQPAVGEAIEDAIATLRDLGAEVRPVEIPGIELAVVLGLLIVLPEASAYHQRWLREKGEQYQPDVRTFLQAGELVLATDYLQAQRQRTAFNQGIATLLEQVDLLLAPTEPMVAPRIGQQTAALPGGAADVLAAAIQFTAPFNVSGLPALSVPCGVSGGLPIGLQLIGRPWDEATVLRAGYAYEQATPWHTQRAAL
jgi:aspartyl-tRNA(Asn)/glutamyl-tRNA(Gln) amidotransferase subunit A